MPDKEDEQLLKLFEETETGKLLGLFEDVDVSGLFDDVNFNIGDIFTDDTKPDLSELFHREKP